MQSPCIRQASQACFHGCCLNPFLGLPEPLNLALKDGAPNPRSEFIAATQYSLYPNTQFTNHESLPSLAQSFSNLNKAYPKYRDTDQADQIRTQEYYHLSLSNHVCLDYTGHCLFSYSQQLHCTAPFFNVSYKSINLNSQLSIGGQESEFESIVKKRIMSFMNISADDYTLVFTANQLSAFKLLADSYSFQTNRKLLTVYDHENEAVESMVNSSKKRGAKVMSAEFSWPNMRIHSRKLRKMVFGKKKKKNKGLFVFPLQSKMTGARYSYLWMSVAQENGWNVCLDASALGAKDMETLGLSLFQPDFLICSFYKVFGENPSGFGCLFVKKSRASVLSNSGTSLGVVSLLPATKQELFLENSPIADLKQETTELYKEDVAMPSPSSSSSISYQHTNEEIQEIEIMREQRQRQLSFSEIMESERSFRNIQSRKSEASGSGSSGNKFGGLDHADTLGLILISSRARYLVNWLVNALSSLQHPHSEYGLPLVKIYGPKIRLDRGPAVAFNLFDWKGEKIDPTLVQKIADRNNISLSYATLKHIVFSDKNHEERERMIETKNTEGNMVKLSRDKLPRSIPVITASLGFLTNFEDTYRLWAFISRFLDADFVEKERWRYMALNRTTVEV